MRGERARTRALVCVCRSESSSWLLVLPFQHVGSRTALRLSGLAVGSLTLNHLTSLTSSLFKHLKYFVIFNSVYVCVSVCTLGAGVHRGQRCLIHLELELQAVVRHLVWVLRLELVSSGRRVRALNP